MAKVQSEKEAGKKAAFQASIVRFGRGVNDYSASVLTCPRVEPQSSVAICAFKRFGDHQMFHFFQPGEFGHTRAGHPQILLCRV